jgi:hypothetical protein
MEQIHLRKIKAQKVNEEDGANQRPVGRPKKLDNNSGDVKGFPSGNSAAYAIRRLRKDRPDIHARVLAGELTPHAGVIEAGFRKKAIRKERTPFERVLALLPKLTAAERAKLQAALAGEGRRRRGR